MLPLHRKQIAIRSAIFLGIIFFALFFATDTLN